jgi:hypothetical protein
MSSDTFVVNVHSDFAEATEKLWFAARQQAQFAMAKTLTTVAKIAENDIRTEMRDVFDRPNAWTLGGTFVKPATPQSLYSMVKLKDERAAGSSTPARKYLQFEIGGGERSLKRFEKALRSAGVLPEGMFAVPGKGIKRDAFGNVPAGEIVKLLSYFRAFPEKGYKANATDESRAKIKKGTRARGVVYFVGRPGGGKLPLGIWARVRVGTFGSALKPILMFTNTASYAKRFDFEGVVTRTAERTLLPIFRQEFAEALRTANVR